MIDLTEMNIMFTLNGEMLISDSGSEMAFKDIEIGEGKTEIDILPYLVNMSERNEKVVPRKGNLYARNFLFFLCFRLYSSLYTGPFTSWKDQPGSKCQQPALLCHLWPAGRV